MSKLIVEVDDGLTVRIDDDGVVRWWAGAIRRQPICESGTATPTNPHLAQRGAIETTDREWASSPPEGWRP